MTNYTKAVVHHAEDMFGKSDQMHWVADLHVNNSLPTVEHILDDIFARTNNIEDRWIDREGVVCYKQPMNGKGHRSTSRGDTIALHTEDGRYLYYKVAFIGFDKVIELKRHRKFKRI